MNSAISPACAFGRGPSGRGARTPRATSRRRPRRTTACSSASARARCRASSYGEIADTTTAAPARASREATQPMRPMFVSRSSFEKPRSLVRCSRTTSPSSRSTSRPRSSSSVATRPAIVDLPAAERPVNQTTKPLMRAPPCAGRTRSSPRRPSDPRGPRPAACSACSRSTRSRGRAARCRAARARWM